VGGNDEQHPQLGGGDSFIGADLQIATAPEDELKQLNLFDLFPSVEEQAGTIAAAEAGVKHTKPAAFSLSENELDDILRTGGGYRDSRKRIYAKYQVHKSPAEMENLLKSEYGTTGKGFIFSGHPVSAWFDGNGMKVGYGTSADENTIMTMGWGEIEGRIRGLVESGEYMNRTEAFLVEQGEQKRVANQIYYFFSDGMGDLPESFQISGTDYPVSEARIMEMLAAKEGRDTIGRELEKAKNALESGGARLKWNYVKSPDYLLDEVADLDTERIKFPLNDDVGIKQEGFITQDEIDAVIKGQTVRKLLVI
jgi:hypothetical protein